MPDEHDEGSATIYRILQADEPLLPLANALVVFEHREPPPLELCAEVRCRLRVVAAVAQKNLVVQ